MNTSSAQTSLILLVLAGCASTGGEKYRIRPDEELLAGRAAWLAGPKVQPKERLNVVLIVADDLGRADTSLYPEGRIATPNLDQLANDGVRFDNGYVTAALCSPSRASLLTGRYQQRFGHEAQPHDRYAQSGLEFFFAQLFLSTDDWKLLEHRAPDAEDVQRQGIPKSELLLPELLHRAGYATGMFGKWHLGWNEDFQPHRRGFDDFTGFYEAYSLYADPPTRDGVINQRLPEFSDRFIWERGRTNISQFVHNGAPITDDSYSTDRFTTDAVKFIDAHKDEPFFLYLPFQNPHTPFQAKREDWDAFPDEKDPIRRTYLALIRSLDTSIGRVLAALKERGLEENTLVIFISDNGSALYTHATSSAPLQGGKFTLFEGGIRVPFVMRWPNKIPKGARYAEPVSAVDVVATIAAATELPLPTDRTYDGVDLTPFLRGEQTNAPHESLFWRAGYTSAIRSGPLKLIRDQHSNVTSLFDLAIDPGERTDLSAQRPDDVKRLLNQLDAWNAQCREPLWPAVMDYRFIANDGRAYWYPL
ncbi:MAG: sulfatase-like hydrolase/transferase [Archangium sp.]|nr:sulfatase-like hydrolase/transferase [Archangium sp.]